MTTVLNNRLKDLFENRDSSDKVMSLFITAGYPDIESTADLILGFEKNGADLVELGIPFSDPLADGPTIQESSYRAIQNGITVDKILDIVKTVRKKSELPLILMGYLNPLLHYGVERFCRNAAEAGVDGLIIPDVTIEESSVIQKPATDNGLSLIYLVAPNTSSERMRKIDQASDGFVYCVSVTGVTGARDGGEVARSVQLFINRIKENVTINPGLIGFGIRSHADAVRVAEQVEGFIVGSALIDVIRSNYPDKGWKDSVFKFVKELKYGNINK